MNVLLRERALKIALFGQAGAVPPTGFFVAAYAAS